jgi:hypothetical protein
MDDVTSLQARVCVLATEFAGVIDTYPTTEVWQMRHRKPPTREEILRAKETLDKAFDKWLTRT